MVAISENLFSWLLSIQLYCFIGWQVTTQCIKIQTSQTLISLWYDIAHLKILIDYEDASKCQLVKGIELSSKVNNCPKTCQDELKLDPHHLKPILNEIFRHCSTMIICFPSHNYAQVITITILTGHNYTDSVSI